MRNKNVSKKFITNVHILHIPDEVSAPCYFFACSRTVECDIDEMQGGASASMLYSEIAEFFTTLLTISMTTLD